MLRYFFSAYINIRPIVMLKNFRVLSGENKWDYNTCECSLARTWRKSSKFFLNLEKRNHEKKRHIRKLLMSGLISTDSNYKLLEQKSFYSNLHKSEVTSLNASEEFLKSLNTSSITWRTKAVLQRPNHIWRRYKDLGNLSK